MKKFIYMRVYCPICEGDTVITDVGFSADGTVCLDLYCEVCKERSAFTIPIEDVMAKAVARENPQLLLSEGTKTMQ